MVQLERVEVYCLEISIVSLCISPCTHVCDVIDESRPLDVPCRVYTAVCDWLVSAPDQVSVTRRIGTMHLVSEKRLLGADVNANTRTS